MVQYIFLSIALLALLNLLFINILDIITYYHDNYSCAANAGRIRGASEPIPAPAGEPDFVELGGLRYSVEWIIKDGDYLI